MNFKELEAKVHKTHEEGITLEEAEKFAAEFLTAQFQVSEKLRSADLDARMRKSGLKAVQAAAYLTETQGKDKKPTEATLQHLINTNEEASKAQDGFDTAEVEKVYLERSYEIFQNAHQFYKAMLKRFE
jgi:hypothetical protein